MARKTAFKHILQRYTRISFNSGGAWRWFCASAVVPGLLPGYPRWAVLLTPVCQIIQGGGTFTGSCSGPLLIGWRLSGRDKGAKGMYDKSETASKPVRFELEKSEKNRRNLKLIQTCDFFILCILYIFLCNVDWRDVKFSLHYI